MCKKMVGFALLCLLATCSSSDRKNSGENNFSSDSISEPNLTGSIPQIESKTEFKGSSFIDERDGLSYKVFKCEGLIWMAENLNYNLDRGAFCYNENKENCNKYGQLYTWKAAQQACPKGWHLPSKEEWLQLARWGGGYHSEENEKEEGDASAAYARLMDQQFIGFGGQLGGRKNDTFQDVDQSGFYWSSTELGSGDIWSFGFDYSHGWISSDRLAAQEACSCRCVLD